MISYKDKPFFLDDDAVAWVEESYASLSLDEKIGQLFCPIAFSKDETELKKLVVDKHIGGALYREGPAEEIRQAHAVMQAHAKIPLLLASNLESGGTGSAVEGTDFGRHMLVAATGKSERAYQLGLVSCREGAAVGVNWSFAPVVDLDLNYHNPITNTRTFGSDVDTVTAMGKAYLAGAQEAGVAVSVKHFPGDGVDERDQHLVTSVNTLSYSDWNSSYGSVYRAMIEAGALTIMAGHIALPAYEEACTGEEVKEIIPATLSRNLLQKLLREELGFQGLITTDATPMVGFCAAMERARAVPYAIEAGCDMFLFNKNFEEDFALMKQGYADGILSSERLEAAVKRILATKAALGLHRKQREGTLVPAVTDLRILRNPEHRAWAKATADEGVTLVKDRAGLLPLDPAKHRRVLLQIMGSSRSNERVQRFFTEQLTAAGMEVTVYQPEGFEALGDSVASFKSRYDLVLYVANVETASNQTVARLHWHTMFGLGNNMPWMAAEMPVLFVSLGNPYHLLDVPMIKTYVNAYCNYDHVMEAVVAKIFGRSEFKGQSPVDAFMGKIDTRL